MNLRRSIPMRALLLAFMSLALAGSAALRDDATLFFKGGRIPRIVIELAPEAIEALRKEPRAYAPCVVREGDRVVGEKAGIKLKGAAGSFQEFDARPAFTINIDKFGEAAPYHGLAKFHLNNSVQDESLLSEWTCSEILRSADQPATRVTHARVMVAGRDLGVYVLKEAFDEKFLARNFKAATGNLYDGGFCQDLDAELERDEGKGANDHADVRAIAEACTDPDMKKRWERIEKLVDIESFVRFVALEAISPLGQQHAPPPARHALSTHAAGRAVPLRTANLDFLNSRVLRLRHAVPTRDRNGNTLAKHQRLRLRRHALLAQTHLTRGKSIGKFLCPFRLHLRGLDANFTKLILQAPLHRLKTLDQFLSIELRQ